MLTSQTASGGHGAGIVGTIAVIASLILRTALAFAAVSVLVLVAVK